MDNCPFVVIFPLNMVIFHGYVSLPEDMCKNEMTEKHFHIPIFDIFDIYGDLMGRKILMFHIANGKAVESVMGQATGVAWWRWWFLILHPLLLWMVKKSQAPLDRW